MDGGPIVMKVPVKRVTVRIAGADVQGIQFADFWRAEYGDNESHVVSNPIREWLWLNNVGVPVPEIVFVLEGANPPDEASIIVDGCATTGDAYNTLT